MKVSELIEKLQLMPGNARVWALYDCFCQIDPEIIWLSRSGEVIMAPFGDLSTDDEDWPEGAIGENSVWVVANE